MTTCSFKSTDFSTVKFLHANSLVCDFKISTQRFKSTTMVDLMKQIYFIIGSIVCKRSPAVAPKGCGKSLDLCTEYCLFECVKMCSRICIYIYLRSIRTLNPMAEEESEILDQHESRSVKMCISIG